MQEESEGAKRALSRVERELVTAREGAAADLAAQREQFEGLLTKARAAQVGGPRCWKQGGGGGRLL